MAFIDYYKILGVAKDTPQDDIRTAYKKRAKQFHPDLHPDDPKAKAKFQALSEAYEVIGDERKRALYDHYGEHWKEASAYGDAAGNGAGSAEGFSSDDLSDILRNAFGGFGDMFTRTRHVSPVGDYEATVAVDFFTLVLGGDIVVKSPSGSLKIHIKPLTQNGARMRLKRKENTTPEGCHTDLILTLQAKLPSKMTEDQTALFRQLQASYK